MEAPRATRASNEPRWHLKRLLGHLVPWGQIRASCGQPGSRAGAFGAPISCCLRCSPMLGGAARVISERAD